MTRRNARRTEMDPRAQKVTPIEVNTSGYKPQKFRRFDLLSNLQPMLQCNIMDRRRPPITFEKLIDPKNDSLVKACTAAKRGSTLSRYEKREVMDAIGKVDMANPITKALLTIIARAESLPKRIRQTAKDRFVV